MYKLTRLINNLNGYLEEVSAQMCASSLLGTPDVWWVSHETWFCHAWPALRHVSSMLRDTMDHDDDEGGDVNDGDGDEGTAARMENSDVVIGLSTALQDPSEAVLHVIGGEEDLHMMMETR